MTNSAIKRVVPISNRVKKEVVSVPANIPKTVVSYLKKRALYFNAPDLVMLNLATCVVNTDFDKARFIQLIRGAIDLLELNSKGVGYLGFFGLADLTLKLRIRYGDRACLNLCQIIHILAEKHIEAYLAYLKSSKKVEIKTGLDYPFESGVFYDGSVGKLIRCWVESERYFYIHDLLLEDLLAFGYTQNQLKTLIHLSQTKKSVELFPEFIVVKYFRMINSKKEIEDILKYGFRERVY